MPIRITLAHGVAGGMERHHDTLARGLAGRGHRVTVVTTAHPDGRLRHEDGGVETLYVPRTTWRRYQRHWWEAGYDLLRERHAGQPYDLILSQSAGGLGYLGRARQTLGLPSVVVLHGSSQSEMVSALRGARNPRGVYRLLRLGWRLPPMWWRWRRVAPLVAYWIAVSPTVGRANQRELGLPPHALTIVPNGVDTGRFQPDPTAPARLRARLGLPSDAVLLVVATRLEFEKGVHLALEALARLRPAERCLYLLVAGKGVYGPTLERRAQALGLGGHVRWLGFVEHTDLPSLLAGSDIFVFASLQPESMTLSILEAQAAGLPVVASDAGGVAEAPLVGQTGFQFRRGDVASLVGRLEPLLADPVRRRAMGALGRRLAEHRFSVEAMVTTTEAILYQSLPPNP